jgi:hypothetical protein
LLRIVLQESNESSTRNYLALIWMKQKNCWRKEKPQNWSDKKSAESLTQS